MKSGPGAQDLLTFSLLLVAARCVDAFTLNMTVHCPPEKLNWTEARRYCQENYRDLVTLDLVNTVNATQAMNNAGVGQAWIGLHRDPEDDRVWKWINLTSGEGISGEDLSTNPGWDEDQQSANCARTPNNNCVTEDCGTFDSGTLKWHSNACSEKSRFACFDDNVVMVTENKTWEDALSHCRGMLSPCEDKLNTCRYRYELLSLEQPTDYSYVRKRLFKAETDEVWTSLRFLGGEWFWVDGTKLEDDGKLPDCPSPGEYCGTLSRNETNDWIARDCSELRNFICYKEKYNPTLL